MTFLTTEHVGCYERPLIDVQIMWFVKNKMKHEILINEIRFLLFNKEYIWWETNGRLSHGLLARFLGTPPNNELICGVQVSI